MSYAHNVSEAARAQAQPPLPEALVENHPIKNLAQNALQSLQQARLGGNLSVGEILEGGAILPPREKPPLFSLLRLNVEECRILKNIFKQWNLGPNLPLFTVFRVDLERRIASLHLSKKKLGPILEFLHAHFSEIDNFYGREYLRAEAGSLFSEYTDQQFPTWESIRKDSVKLRKQLNDLLKSNKAQEADDFNSTASRKINLIFDIFVKILDLDCNEYFGEKNDTDTAILTHNFEDFIEAEWMPPLSIKNNRKILDGLSAYMDVFGSIKIASGSSKEPPSSPFENLAMLCSTLQKEEPLKLARVTAMKKELTKQWRSLISLIKKVPSIPHRSLFEQIKLGALEPKHCQRVEHALLARISMQNILRILSIFTGIFDCQVARPFFPDFLPMGVHIQRLLINWRSYRLAFQEEIQESNIPPPPGVAQEFQKHLSTLIVPIEKACSEMQTFLDQLLIPHADEENFLHLLQGASYSTGAWIAPRLSEEGEPLCDRILPKINSKAATFAKGLEQFFQEHAQALSEIHSEQDREAIIDEIQTIYWEKTLFIRRMVMIIEDVLAITKGTSLSRDKKYSAWESIDLIAPDRLYALLWPGVALEEREEIPSSKIEAILDDLREPSSPPAESAAAAAEVEAPLEAEAVISKVAVASQAVLGGQGDEEKGAKRALPAPKPVNLPRQQKVKVKEESANPFVSPDLLEMRKFRDIFKALTDAEFIVDRVNGSHFIMADRFGRIVPVPRHREIKKGTVYGIYSLATAPLRER